MSDAKNTTLECYRNDKQVQWFSRLAGWLANIVNVPRILYNIITEILSIHWRLVKLWLAIPLSVQTDILKCVHKGHMGIEKCNFRIHSCVYWPSTFVIEQEVQSCPMCAAYSKQNQKLRATVASPHLTWQWEKLEADCFH